MSCNETDFMFPMLADIYYSTSVQGAYGEVQRTWVIDRSVVGNFVYAGAKNKEEIEVDIEMVQDSLILARTKEDLRIAFDDTEYDLTTIVVTNIRDCNDNEFYLETSGPRAGLSTIFEIATQQPFINPFGQIEHYRLVLRRAENQGAM